MIDNEKNIAFWDQTAQRSRTGAKTFAGMLMEDREFEAIYRCEAEQERFLGLLSPTRKTRVLEVGSGGGRWGLFLADKVSSYVGLDISPRMIEIAEEERARRQMSNVRFECRSLLEFGSDQMFDLVYFSGVLQYMDDEVVELCLAKAASLLSKGGAIISRDSVQKSSRVEKAGDYPVIYRTEAEYLRFFGNAGFTQAYSDLSYAHKRFTKLASRLYALPGVTYKTARFVRDALCSVDKVLGCPPFLKTPKHKEELLQENPQEHRFTKYVRN